jgi:predicted N-acetyltransferase YhbS
MAEDRTLDETIDIRPMANFEIDRVVSLLAHSSASDNPHRLLERLSNNSPGELHVSFVADINGTIVGAAKATGEPTMPGTASVSIVVTQRERGIGCALYQVLMNELEGSCAVLTCALRDDSTVGRAFAESRDFSVAQNSLGWKLHITNRGEEFSGRRAALEAETGLKIRPADMVADHSAIIDCSVRSARGALPGPLGESAQVDASQADSYFPANATYLLAEIDGFAVGVGVVHRISGSRSRWYTDITAVDPAFRNRGVARTLKFAELEVAARAGGRWMITHNDQKNEGIIRVNSSLGMEPTLGYWTFVRSGTRKTNSPDMQYAL